MPFPKHRRVQMQIDRLTEQSIFAVRAIFIVVCCIVLAGVFVGCVHVG